MGKGVKRKGTEHCGLTTNNLEFREGTSAKISKETSAKSQIIRNKTLTIKTPDRTLKQETSKYYLPTVLQYFKTGDNFVCLFGYFRFLLLPLHNGTDFSFNIIKLSKSLPLRFW